MKEESRKNYQHKILTIPNALSLFRLLLIPVFIWVYRVRQKYLWTAGLLVVSGVTDLLDGYIARRFHMISDLGKVLDPLADKLTQGAMLFCLLSRFPLMMAAFIILIVKEALLAATGFLVIRGTGDVYGADWHGKVTTTMLYGMMIIHVVWYNIPQILSDGLVTVCMVMMSVSLIIYVIRNLKILIKHGRKKI